jgi:hypothetical protein
MLLIGVGLGLAWSWWATAAVGALWLVVLVAYTDPWEQ